MKDGHLLEQTRLASAGDVDALQRLIVHYHPLLWSRVADRLGPAMKPKFDPEDILQDAYTKAYQAAGNCSFGAPGGFYKWLERITDNAMNQRLRFHAQSKRDYRREIPGPIDSDTNYPNLVHTLTGDLSTPGRRLRREEAMAVVLSALARLPDEQQAVIRLRFLMDRSVSETAAELDVSDDRVYALSYQAVVRLRRYLASLIEHMTPI